MCHEIVKRTFHEYLMTGPVGWFIEFVRSSVRCRNVQRHVIFWIFSVSSRKRFEIDRFSDETNSSTDSLLKSVSLIWRAYWQYSHPNSIVRESIGFSNLSSELVSWCAWPGVKSITRWAQKPSPCGDRFLIRENPNCTILPLDSRNQESAQIPGFWNPMVKWCNWDFLWS
jgi:hypothetical protein